MNQNPCLFTHMSCSGLSLTTSKFCTYTESLNMDISQGLMSKHSQYQRGVVVIGKNTPPTQTRRKLPNNAQVRLLSFTATNSERNLNWPSICRHGWAGAFENSQKKCTDKTNKLDQKGCGERSGEHSTKMMTITPLVVIILE